MLLRSRIVLPITRPPIENGAVLISGNSVVRAGHWKEFSGNQTAAIDLGDVVLLPGLVNAHCHLDYTGMAGMVPAQRSFTDWIRFMLAAKAEWNYSEFAASWLQGARMLLRTGTTTVADFEAVPELLPEVWTATPLRVFSFLEMTGIRTRRDPRVILSETVRRIESLPAGRCRASLAPHAPYSTMPELMRLSAETARQRRWPWCTHLAESRQEFEMFTEAGGVMFDWLRRNERDAGDCGLGSPVALLERNGALTEQLVAVHVNYLARKDAALLARRKVSVAHCPRSHAYFGHDPFPFRELAKARVNICLGTDSLATINQRKKETIALNLFEEMRHFIKANPAVAPKTVLQMATLNGARALGLSGRIGEISKGALADLVAIPFTGKMRTVYDAVPGHAGDVHASLINGEWALAPAA